MTFDDFIKAVARSANVSQIDATRILWAIPAVLKDRVLEKGDRLIWPSLGTFEQRKLEPKTRLIPAGIGKDGNLDPAQKVPRQIRAQNYVGFRTSSNLKVRF